MPKRRSKSRLKDYLFPHRGNRYKPTFFSSGSVLAIIAAVLILEGAYLASTRYIFPNTNFLASVLPSVLTNLTNDDRAAADAPPVTLDPLLSQAAQTKADDMASKGYFSHVTPDGKQPWYWFDLAGYKYTYAGENLAVNFNDSDEVEQAWMASPTHHANIIKSQYTQVGYGVAQGTYQGKSATFVVEFFATKPAGAIEPEPGTPTATSTTIAATPKEKTEASTTRVALAAVPNKTLTTASVSTTTPVASTTAVLGAAIAPPATGAAIGFFGRIATSPEHTLIYLLTLLIGLTAALLMVAIMVKLRIQYREVITGGLAVMLVALALLVFTETTSTKVMVSSDTQSAAVFQAFGS